MTDLNTIMNTTAVRFGHARGDTALTKSLQTRSRVLLLTQQAEDAVLKPADSGGWPHELRIALAARIATQNALPELASHYAQMICDDKFNGVADLSNDGSELNLQHVVAFIDQVAVRPRDIEGADIRILQDHAISDADIVRLTQLVAFMAYQLQLIAGLKLMTEVLV
jgi:uncharacterized protein YciW